MDVFLVFFSRFTSSIERSSDISDMLLMLFFGRGNRGGRVTRRISPGIRRCARSS